MLDFLLQIVQTPAIILGLIAMIGLLLQRKSFGAVFSGTVKTAVGMLIVGAGSTLIVTEVTPFSTVFSEVFHLNGFATSSEAVVGALQTNVKAIAATSALIMGLGFVINLLAARFTPLKYIFLTGHMMWILSIVIASGLVMGGFSNNMTVVIGALLQGMITSILPSIAQPSVEKVTKTSMFGMGHLTTFGTVLAGYIGGALGNKDNDAEDIKLPAYLSFFKDTAMSVSIVMGVFYLILFIIAGPDAVKSQTAGQNYLVFALLKAMGFTAGILVLLQGIRLFLGEIVPAFKGISDKLVPGALPALDVPVLFGFAPNALMIGFLSGIIGMLLGMVTSGAVFGMVPLISIIGSFFTGGVAGIFGNARGGRRGAAIAGTVYGFLLIFSSALFARLVNLTQYGVKGVGYDCTDAVVVGLLLKNPWIGIGITVAAFVLMCVIEVRRKAAAPTEAATSPADTK
ncbi:PTS ascorbate transporter subunit IIC [Lacticaseibacillus daqingensis]|uniref:PTS ascorbate transporter subunit IIC n=1 Tax=Lacticaseibacillus daqingensis TaxID=2486014 RepID=UPI000F78A9BF|nr:PTS ascorbate transporter subunit IIC [Lacticaseibacillus daqingensis]